MRRPGLDRLEQRRHRQQLALALHEGAVSPHDVADVGEVANRGQIANAQDGRAPARADIGQLTRVKDATPNDSRCPARSD